MFETISVVGAGGKGAAQAVVIGHFAGQAPDKAAMARADDAAGAVASAAKRGEATGEVGRLAEAFPVGAGKPERVILVGLGKPDGLTGETLRTVAGAVGRRLAQAKLTSVQWELEAPLAEAKMDVARAGQALGEGLGLLGWVCEQFKGSVTKGKETAGSKRQPLSIRAVDKAFMSGLERGLKLAASANLTRTLSETPPNVATPAFMAEQAEALAQEHGLGCTIFRGKDLDRERMTGLINVGKASENKPCLIRLEYNPGGAGKGKKKTGRGNVGDQPVVLIGKAMCYDSGGLSLKINNGMVGMKRDKDGGCAVLGAMHAVATVIKPARRVLGFLAAAENSISDEAYRPDDIITYRNGVTVEITNTDAEGRLVLADALCYVCEKENPAAIIDLATLTGGVVVALGSTYCGMFCENDALRGKLEAAAAASGERLWRLPMHQEYRDMMKSPVADIINSNPNRKAHPIQGAAFLSYFVDEKVPWCHLDIAGVHAVDSDTGPFVKGPTGWGVRLLAEYLSAEE